MKYTFVLLLSVLVFVSCKKENEASSTPGTDPIDTLTQTTLYTGNFVKGPWGTVTGRAKILRSYTGKLMLALDSVVISNGPDLHVYLSKEVQPTNFIDLGLLKSISGNQLYSISGMPDFTQYKYALIHCQKYNHLFGSAELIP